MTRRIAWVVVMLIATACASAGDTVATESVAVAATPTAIPTTAPAVFPTAPPTALPLPTVAATPTMVASPTATPIPPTTAPATAQTSDQAESAAPTAAPVATSPAVGSESAEIMATNGAEVYTIACARCHAENGTGTQRYSGLIGVGRLYSNAAMIEELTNGHPVTFGFAGQLSADEIASVVAYVKATFP